MTRRVAEPMSRAKAGAMAKAPRRISGFAWMEDEEETLRSMVRAGATAVAVADALPARSLKAVRKRAAKVGLRFAEMPVGRRPGVKYPSLMRGIPHVPEHRREVIPCLSCHRPFATRCRTKNRVCPKCSTESDVFFGYPG